MKPKPDPCAGHLKTDSSTRIRPADGTVDGVGAPDSGPAFRHLSVQRMLKWGSSHNCPTSAGNCWSFSNPCARPNEL